ncbi:DNA adenine methylase [Bosea sp. LjRoot90]|uniref:DNA adenine methylase n=1 Tax=Bosea sp. LjRoot90 TaxID=3342342 RepID=UPI003ECD9C6E
MNRLIGGLSKFDSPAFVKTTPAFRPVQYLGNKLRVLNNIAEGAMNLIGSQGSVVDLFTGTSVVAQTFAHRGYSVIALDTQNYAKVFASATLGIGRVDGIECPAETLLAQANSLLDEPAFSAWASIAARERSAIEAGDLTILRSLYEELPLAWRDPSHPHHRLVLEGDGRPAFQRVPLIASVHAGSYFGINQALMIDALRHVIEHNRKNQILSDWQVSAALTGLMSAASAAVHSAGKHFAQPLTAGSGANMKFRSKRIIDDRRVCIGSVFTFACKSLNLRSVYNGQPHCALQTSAEEFLSRPGASDLYYADPPYTAQQYSRFYHILETICHYNIESLLHGDETTTGLYTNDRYRSAFSSKAKAKIAFKDMIGSICNKGGCLIISYSVSSIGSNGNARMIGLDDIIDLARSYYGTKRVAIEKLDHSYRQFNSGDLANSKRDDPEIMIACSI